MTGVCSACLLKQLTKQLGYQVRADNGMFCGTGKLFGVSMEGRNLTVILKIENRELEFRFQRITWVKRLEFLGELPKGSVSNITSKGREAGQP